MLHSSIKSVRSSCIVKSAIKIVRYNSLQDKTRETTFQQYYGAYLRDQFGLFGFTAVLLSTCLPS